MACNAIFRSPRAQWPSSAPERLKLRNILSTLIRCRYSSFHAFKKRGSGPRTRRLVLGFCHISASQWMIALVPPVLSGQAVISVRDFEIDRMEKSQEYKQQGGAEPAPPGPRKPFHPARFRREPFPYGTSSFRRPCRRRWPRFKRGESYSNLAGPIDGLSSPPIRSDCPNAKRVF